jgi:hypothetical protein
MCYAVFIATSTPQQTSEFVAGETLLYLAKPSEDELCGLKDKFNLPYIYYVGSDSQCSCGLEFHSQLFNDPEWQDSKPTVQAFIDLLNHLTIENDIEYYCCWDGDWRESVETTRIINSHDISLEKNYFELIEREFIKFEKYIDHSNH